MSYRYFMTAIPKLSKLLFFVLLTRIHGSKSQETHCVKIHRQDEPFCYRVLNRELSWTSCNKTCAEDHLGLVISDSESLLYNLHDEVIQEQKNSAVWIGYTRTTTQWGWTYNMSATVIPRWTNRGDFPINEPAGRDCAISVASEGFKWSPRSCGEAHGFICETDAASEKCEEGPLVYDEVLVVGKRCFMFRRSTNTGWFRAKRECERNGNKLASLDDDAIYENLLKLEGDQTLYWIALTKATWLTYAGNSLEGNYWLTDQPQGVGGCAVIQNTAGSVGWADALCTETEPACVCRVSHDQSETTLATRSSTSSTLTSTTTSTTTPATTRTTRPTTTSAIPTTSTSRPTTTTSRSTTTTSRPTTTTSRPTTTASRPTTTTRQTTTTSRPTTTNSRSTTTTSATTTSTSTTSTTIVTPETTTQSSTLSTTRSTSTQITPIEQTISGVPKCIPVDLCFAVDISSSLSSLDREYLKEFLHPIMDYLHRNYSCLQDAAITITKRYSLKYFDSLTRTIPWWVSITALTDQQPGNLSEIFAVIKDRMFVADRLDYADAVLLLLHADHYVTSQDIVGAWKLKNNGTKVLVVTFSAKNAHSSNARLLASEPQGLNTFHLNSGSDLTGIQMSLLQTLQALGIPSTTSSTTPPTSTSSAISITETTKPPESKTEKAAARPTKKSRTNLILSIVLGIIGCLIIIIATAIIVLCIRRRKQMNCCYGKHRMKRGRPNISFTTIEDDATDDGRSSHGSTSAIAAPRTLTRRSSSPVLFTKTKRLINMKMKAKRKQKIDALAAKEALKNPEISPNSMFYNSWHISKNSQDRGVFML